MSREADAVAGGRRQGGGGAAGARNLIVRIARAWNALGPEQRLAGWAAAALWVAMLLPWYSRSTTFIYKGAAKSTEQSLSAFQDFSFVEAAVLLVSAALLAMLFARGERRAFHLPGGDGFIITAGGVWTAILIFYRMLDKPGTTGSDKITTTIGIRWGIFLALIAAIGLAYAGVRVKAAHRPEPDLASDPTVRVAVRPTAPRPPADDAPRPPRYPPRPSGAPRSEGAQRTERTTRAVSREDAEQLSFDVPDPPPSEPDPFGERRR
jgi:hypothetical protein